MRPAEASFSRNNACNCTGACAPYRRLQLRMRNRLSTSFSEHCAIVDAIFAGNGEDARRLLRGHVGIQGERFSDLVASMAARPSRQRRTHGYCRLATLVGQPVGKNACQSPLAARFRIGDIMPDISVVPEFPGKRFDQPAALELSPGENIGFQRYPKAVGCRVYRQETSVETNRRSGGGPRSLISNQSIH